MPSLAAPKVAVPSRVIVSAAATVLARGMPTVAPWVYLGKNVGLLRQVEVRAGSSRRSLGSRLHEASVALRQPFLDFVADIGREQDDPVLWWSTTFSWKVWGASDFFLLLCYLRVAHDLIQDAAVSQRDLVIVVEDRWLLAQIRRNHAESEAVDVTERAGLGRLKVVAVAAGVARRAAWLMQTIVGWSRQRRAWPDSASLAEVGVTAGVYTYPMDRCLRDNGGWSDALLPGIDDLLRCAGHSVAYFSTPERVGFEQAIGERHRGFLPLVLFLSVPVVVRSLCAFWPPRRRAYPPIAGLPIDLVARREWWTDLARAAWCRNRMFFECARRMVLRGSFEWLVFPFENQPWEKLLVLAARERGVKTAGFQHSTLGLNYLSYFLGRDEAGHMPLPDVVLTAGTFAQAALTQGGYPPGRVRMTGSLRYQHLSGTSEEPVVAEDAPSTNVLVALPIDRPMAEHLLAALGAAFTDGGTADGLRFFVKCHPMTPVDPAAFGLPAETVSASFEQVLRKCGTVVFVGSITGAEAAVSGRAVLRYRPELLIDVDVSGAMSAIIGVCGDEDLRAQLLAIVAAERRSAAPGTELTESLFATVEWDALSCLFRRSVPTASRP